MNISEQIEGCIKNNMISQNIVFNTYSKKLLAVCIRYFEKIEDAEDCLTESFILIFKHIKQYNGGLIEKVFYGWMKRITVNVCLSKIRSSKFEKLQDSLEEHIFHLKDETIHESFGVKDLLKIIHTLPTGFRTIFNLFVIEGYTHKEIGQMLNISEGTSKSQYARARMHLQNKLKKIGITNSIMA